MIGLAPQTRKQSGTATGEVQDTCAHPRSMGALVTVPFFARVNCPFMDYRRMVREDLIRMLPVGSKKEMNFGKESKS